MAHSLLILEPAVDTNDLKIIAACDPLALANQRPEWSAKEPLLPWQKYGFFATLLAIAAALAAAPLPVGRLLILVATLYYLVAMLYKLHIVRRSMQPDAAFKFTPEDIAAEEPREWPIYSVIVPMYHEPETVPHMIEGLNKMDYPHDRLDVQLLLEADDTATLEAAYAEDLPAFVRVTEIPPSFPRTKPKACNIGLDLARGEYLVIYDAEDHPEPDQIKKAVMAFERSPKRVACVQSCLNYYNPHFNLLTRWFTAEYSAWYDLCLPGLAAMRAAMPLGGTSNHFKIGILRDLLGWDAYNVTEDCDLGMRIARAGYQTRMVWTTTWEEACSQLPFWIRQRTRWQKGYIQTFAVHTRNPIQLFRELGLKDFLHFNLLIGGSIFSTLINPIFWIMTIAWLIFRPAGVDLLFPGWVFAMSAFCLFVGNFVFVYVNLLGCYQRRYDSLMWANLLTPIYWAMMSYSGWRAFLQFFSNPFLWEKTKHGLHKQ